MTTLHATFPTEVPDALILAIVADVKNPRRLVAVGGQGSDVCLLSDDEGASFRALASPCKGLRNAYLNGDELWVVGEYGHVAVSRDGGVTFTVVPTEAGACLFGVVKDETGALWIAGDGGLILRSVDDGASFTRVPGAKVSLSRLSLMPGVGVVIPSDKPGDLYVCSVDKKGKAKATRWGVDAGADLMVATRTKSGAIVVVGGDGFCARAEGAGGDFTKVAMPTKELLTCCCARADGAVFAVGMSGGVFVSDDDGRSFSAVDVGQKGQWWWVSALGDDVLVGGKATLMRVSAAAPAPFHEEPARLPGVLLSSELRRRVYPWRGVQWGVQADRPAPLPTRDAAWTRLRDLFWDCADERERRAKRGHGIWDRALAPKRADRAVASRLRRAARQDVDVDVARAFVAFAFDDDAQATRTALLHDALADWLVAELGIVDGVRAAFAGLPGELPYSDCGVFGRLRELVAMDDVTSDSDYAALLAQMVPLLEQLAEQDDDEGHVNDLWSAASFVFPPSRHDHDIERQLLERAKSAIGKFGNLDIAHPCLLASVDDDGFGRFLKANPESRHEMFATTRRPYVATLLARGSALFRDRVDGLRPRYDLGVFDWALMLAHVDEDRCMRVLDKHQQEKPHPGIDAALRLRAALTPSVLPQVRGARPPRALAITEAPPAPSAPRATSTSTTSMSSSSGPPARFDLAPVVVLTDGERKALGADQERTRFQGETADKPVPLAQLSDVDVDAYVAARVDVGLPVESELFLVLPPRVHARLFELGVARSERQWVRVHTAAFVKHGASLLPLVRAFAADDSVAAEERLQQLLPIGDEVVAGLALPLFASKKHKALGRAYLQRHPRFAAAAALAVVDDPAASAEAKAAADRALRYLDARGARAAIVALAAHTKDAAAITRSLDDTGPVPRFDPPAWLAKVKRPDAIDDDVLAALSATNADEVHPLVERARQRVAPVEGAAFGRSIFDAWLKSGAGAPTSFCLLALGLFGDDAAMVDLGARADAWPSEGAAARAQLACEALRLHGSPTALRTLGRIGRTTKAAGLKRAALAAAARLIEDAGGSEDAVAHLVAPVDVPAALDFGGRRFDVVVSGGSLALRDARGAVSDAAPKKQKSDDATSFAAAQKEWKRLQKLVDPLVSELEDQLSENAALPGVLFAAAYQQHPVGRLVLAARGADGDSGAVGVDDAVAVDAVVRVRAGSAADDAEDDAEDGPKRRG